jgi:hypothetical protein
MKDKLIEAFHKSLKSIKHPDHIWFSGGCTISGDICISVFNLASNYSIAYDHISEQISREEYLNMFNLASDLKKELEAKFQIEEEERSKKEIEDYLSK